jgi:exodeoxyribonuclease VII large subunit
MADPNEKKVLSVSELTFHIKSKLESLFPFVSVQGEISNFKAQSSGHLYFSLKDKDAQISCVMFKGAAKGLQKMPKIGDQVIVKGDLSVYPPRGGYQLMIRQLTFAGLGDLLLKLHALKESFKAKGYFDPKSKKPLPKSPKRICVITSPTGAVIQDIIHVLQRRSSQFHLILYPVKVQGEGASVEIAKAIDEANKHNIADVLIVGRGGGCMEDLWPFNEENVVTSIFESKIPVVSAVGHETDYTLSDLTADKRAPTPSAAAEIVSDETAKVLQTLQVCKRRVAQTLIAKIRLSKEKLTAFSKHPLFSKKEALLFPFMQKLDENTQKIEQTIKQKILEKKLQLEGMKKQRFDPKHSLSIARNTVNTLQLRLDEAIFSKMLSIKNALVSKNFKKQFDQNALQKLLERKEKIKNISSHLHSINPQNLLEKGYAILFSQKDDSIILSTDQLQKEDKITAHLKDGKLFATIDNIEKNHGRK